MGQAANLCGHDIFGQLKEKYGEDFIKLIVAEKSKQVVDEKFGQLTKESNDLFNGFENQTNTVVDEKSQILKQIFEDAKGQINSTIPGGISAIERIQGKSINEITGYNQLEGRIDEVKNKAIGQISGKRAEVMVQVNNKKECMLQKVQDEKPKVPLYQDLPIPIKKKILKEGEQKFTKEVGQNKEVIIQEIMKQFNPKNFSGFFNQINPEGALQGILSSAMSQFTGSIGGGSGGFIGGFTNNLF